MNDVSAGSAAPRTGGPRERRQAYVSGLYRLHTALENPAASSGARRDLALLRRSLSGQAEAMRAYQVLLRYNPPQQEEHLWLLLGGLFAQSPQPPPTSSTPATLGGSLGRLAATAGISGSENNPVERRLIQLLSVSAAMLPFHLRQCVRLVDNRDVEVNFYRLANDLVPLLGLEQNRAQEIRLSWARDYHREFPS